VLAAEGKLMMRASSFIRQWKQLFICLLFLPLAYSSATGQAQVTGKWNTLPYPMPINPVHAAMLHNGKVLIVSGTGNNPSNSIPQAALWDLTAGTITPQTVSYDMFCNGMVVLPDGRPIVIGGTLKYLSGGLFDGTAHSASYDPGSNTFTMLPNMAHGRWYPTGTVLGDGRVMAFSGDNENDVNNNAVEFYTEGLGWSQQYVASWNPPNYPRLHLLPNGNIFYSGPTPSSAFFNPATQHWTLGVAHTNYALGRTYGSSVLLPLSPQNGYAPKVMILGGMDTSSGATTASTEIIDLSVASPAWKYSAPMSEARVEMNAVLLPSGKVLALGGSSVNENKATASLKADLFDPRTQTMSSAGAAIYARLYHSIALLLPDATVFVAGSNPVQGTYEPHIEIYQPAYLFTTNSSGGTILAPRPTISSAPAAVAYGQSFQLQTPDAANITSVAVLRAGAVTHAFDMEQRMVELNFTTASGDLNVTAPPNGNIAPPGYYLLFLINDKGVPSVASFLQIKSKGIGFVQVNAATPAGSVSTVSVSYNKSQVAGNLNVVAIGWNDTVATVQSVTDSRGNSYSRAVGPTTGTALRQVIYYAKDIAAGSNTVNVTFNQAATHPDVRILEYQGVSTLDVTSGASGSSGSNAIVSSGAASTAVANELIFGAGMTSGGFSGPGANFNKEIITARGDIAEDRTLSGTGSYSATGVLGAYGTQNWIMQMAVFK